jgi:hypothetical protein
MSNTKNPKKYTKQEVENQFLDLVRSYAKEWAALPNKTDKEKCDGLAFSIRCIFDGATDLPAINLVLDPHPEDKSFNQSQGKNWDKKGMIINDFSLHDKYYQEKNNVCD